MKSYILAALTFTLTATQALTQVPNLINYQGRLTDANGNPVTGSKSFTISIHDAATGGNLLYTETIGAVTLDNNGIYSFQFGSAGTSTRSVTESIATTNGTSLTYSKLLSHTPVVNNSITVTDGTNSWIQAVGNPGQGAAANLSVVNGFVIGATVTNGGSGYTSAPAVTVVGNGTGATATAIVSNGVITEIMITNAGSGYTEPPTLIISPPVIPFRVDYANGAISVTYSSTPPSGQVITSSYRYQTNSIRGALTAGQEHWLQLNVDDEIQTTRQRILTVPFSLMASTAEHATTASTANNATTATTASTVVDGAITAEKLAPSAVTTALGNNGNFVVSGADRPDLLSAGFQLFSVMQPVEFTPISTFGAPGLGGHTAIWTGTEMIVFGRNGGNTDFLGARYNPTSNVWTPISSVGAPTMRTYHTAIWTGTEMLIWGGLEDSVALNSGGRYNPLTNTWAPMSTSGAPSARHRHTAIWTGSQMIVWGGQSGSTFFNSGGRYNPTSNTWTTISTSNSPSVRAGHTAVWTGADMIVFGGSNFILGSGSQVYNNGSRYNPSTNSWSNINSNGVSGAREGHTAIWSGTEMIVWGGVGSDGNFLDTGGRYNPTTNSWTAVSTMGLPSARDGHSAVWTGTEMIIWGGGGFYTGARYSPSTDTWITTSILGAPRARSQHSAIWTGSEMIVWGGDGGSIYLNDGARYRSGSFLYFYGKP